MKFKRSLMSGFAIASGMGLVPHAAQAGEGGYFGLFGGANFLEDQTFKTEDYTPPGFGGPLDGATLTRLKADTGWIAGFTMGYATGSLRPELEFAYREDDIKRQRDTAFGLFGGSTEAEAAVRTDSAQAITGMLNLWLDLFKNSSVHPYLGGGAGAINYRLKDPKYLGVDLREDDDTVFAYQFGGGIGFALGKQTDLSLDYRYVKSDDAQFKPFRGAEGRIEEKYEAQSAMLSLRYYFSAPEEPPPPPVSEPVVVVPVEEPPPPPPPPPACELPGPGEPFNMYGCKTGDVMVLRGVNFEFNKASLTTNAKTILDQVSAGLNQRTDIKIELDGHTDSKGSDAYNQSLSERRAGSVMQYLTSKGIDASRLRAVGMGENAPVADNETDAGRELNRRVELKILESSGVGVIVAPPAGVSTPPAADASTTDGAMADPVQP